MAASLTTRIGRRNLLKLGAAGVLSLAVVGSRPRLRLDTLAERAGSPFLTLGFWSGDDATADARFRPGMQPAAELRAGDTTFVSTGARLRILGMATTDVQANCADLAGTTIDVGFAPFHDTRFMAWSFANGGAASASPPAGFIVPIDAATGLNLTIGHRCASDATPTEIPLRLDVGRTSYEPKLRRGTYVIGYRHPSTGALPDWSRYQLRAADAENAGLKRYLYRAGDGQGAPVPADFPYVVFTVDYAAQ
jgi:hypothetical protein